jgi:hypothetical protein
MSTDQVKSKGKASSSPGKSFLRPSTRDTPKRDGDLPSPSAKVGKTPKRLSSGKSSNKPMKSPPTSSMTTPDSFFETGLTEPFSTEFGDNNFFTSDFDNETTGSNPFFKETGSKKETFDPRKYKADSGR